MLDTVWVEVTFIAPVDCTAPTPASIVALALLRATVTAANGMIAKPPAPAARASLAVVPVCWAETVMLSPAVTIAPLAMFARAVFSATATATDAPKPSLPLFLLVEITLSTGVSSFSTAIKRPDASTAVFDPSALTLISVMLVALTSTSLVALVVVLSPSVAVTSLVLLMPIASAPDRPMESDDDVPTPEIA